jgi:hypothetical protein
MIKKILIFLFLCLLIYSCGKKNDPVYNGKKLTIFSIRLIAFG